MWRLHLLLLLVGLGMSSATGGAVGGDIDELFKDEGFLRMSRSGESFANRPPPPPELLAPGPPPPPPQPPAAAPQQHHEPASSGPHKRDKGERSSPDASTGGKEANSAVMPSVSFLDLAFGLDRSPLEKNIAAIFSKVAFGHSANSNTTSTPATGKDVVAGTKKEEDQSKPRVTQAPPPTAPLPRLPGGEGVKPTQVTYAADNSPAQHQPRQPAAKESSLGNNDTEYDFVPILQNPTVTRILAGSTGKRPLPTLLHLPEEIQRRLRENLTSFLNEVNKDSMIDVKPQMPPPPAPPQSQPEQHPPHPSPQPRPPVYPTERDDDDIEDYGRTEPSSSGSGVLAEAEQEAPRPKMAVVDGEEVEVSEGEPGPDRTSTPIALGVAWDVHVYLMGTLFALLAAYSLVSLVRLHGCPHLLPKGYFLTLNSLMLMLGALRAVYLFYDAYNLQQGFPPVVAYLLLHVSFPCITSAFAVLFMALLRATQVEVLSPRLQTPAILAALVLFHFVLVVVTDVVVGCFEQAHWLLLVTQLLSLLWALALAAAYLVAFGSLYRTALRHQGEVIRATFTKMHIEGAALPKRLPRPTLGLAVRVSFALSLLLVLLSGVQVYGLFGVYGLGGLGGMVQEPRPRPWPWWGFLLSERVIEAAVGALVAFLATRPMRCHDPQMPPDLGHHLPGGDLPGAGGHHVVGIGSGQVTAGTAPADRAAVFALFGCGPQLGCGPGLCRCAAAQPDEGKAPAGDELYPTICSSNQAIRNYALTTGRTVYDDSFSLGTGPTVALGDKMVPLSALAKRRPLKKSATLLSTLSDGRSTAPPSCHQGETGGRPGGDDSSSASSASSPSSSSSTRAAAADSEQPGSSGSRPSSMLFSEDGFVRFRTSADPEQPVDQVLDQCSSFSSSSSSNNHSSSSTNSSHRGGRRPHSRTAQQQHQGDPPPGHQPTTSAGGTLVRSSLRSLPARPSPKQMSEGRSRRGLYSLEGTDTSSGDALSCCPAGTTRGGQQQGPMAKYASTCSSESAANSFDVRLFPSSDSGRSSFRPHKPPGEPPWNGSKRRTEERVKDRRHHHHHHHHHHHRQSSPPGSPEATSKSDMQIDFLTDLSNDQFSDSDVAGSSVEPSGYEDNADDEQESDGGGGRHHEENEDRGSRRAVPSAPGLNHCTQLNLNLAAAFGYHPGSCGLPTSQDITPDSAVVADISECGSKNEGGGGGEGNTLPPRLQLLGGKPVVNGGGNPVTDILRISTSSLNEVLSVSAKGLLSKLRGSNFSLNGTNTHYGYSPLGSEDVLTQQHRANSATQVTDLDFGSLVHPPIRPSKLDLDLDGKSQLRPLLVHTGPAMYPHRHAAHSSCPFVDDATQTDFCDIFSEGCYGHHHHHHHRRNHRHLPHLNDLSIETCSRRTSDLNIRPHTAHFYNVCGTEVQQAIRNKEKDIGEIQHPHFTSEEESVV